MLCLTYKLTKYGRHITKYLLSIIYYCINLLKLFFVIGRKKSPKILHFKVWIVDIGVVTPFVCSETFSS